MATAFARYVGTDDLSEFKNTSWGVRPFSASLDAATFAELLDGFGDGELNAVLPHCRKPDNSRCGLRPRPVLAGHVRAG